MLIKEAVELIKNDLECVNRTVEENCNRMCSDCDLVRGTVEIKQAYQMAIEALEKQIPKKVRITTSTKRCATCGRQLSGIGNIHPKRNFCQGCGQAIDWKDE